MTIFRFANRYTTGVRGLFIPPEESKKRVGGKARIGARAPRAMMATLRWNAGAFQSSIEEAI